MVIPIRIFEYVDLGTIQPWSTTDVFVDGLSWMWQEGDADISSNSWGVPDDLLALFPGGDLLVNSVIDDAVEQPTMTRPRPSQLCSGKAHFMHVEFFLVLARPRQVDDIWVVCIRIVIPMLLRSQPE